jgi:hypothetical protein
MEVEERWARRLVTRCCNLAYSDDALASLGIKSDGCETMEAQGYTGYIYPVPPLPPDDALSAVQAVFRDAYDRILNAEVRD